MAQSSERKSETKDLGRLVVGEIIGRGGFGVVHSAQLGSLKRPLAVKFLDPSPFQSDRAAARQRFEREAEVMQRLRHPSIIEVIGSGEWRGKPYILMEHFAGISFDRARDRSAPEPERTLPAFENIAKGLAYAHSEQVLHRDIKPSNLMVTPTSRYSDPPKGVVRILDFGVAAIMDPNAERLTRTGGTIVGDSYAAPELGETPRLLDPRCDIWSFGAVWYYVLTGKAPKGSNIQMLLRDTVTIRRDFEQVILRCLDSVDRRFQSMDDVVAAIGQLRGHKPVPPGPGQLSDDMLVVLGIISQGCPTTVDAPTQYEVETEALRFLSKIRMGIAQRRLLANGLIEERRLEDWENSSLVLALTESGSDAVESHQHRIVELLEGATPAGDEKSDFPF